MGILKKYSIGSCFAISMLAGALITSNFTNVYAKDYTSTGLVISKKSKDESSGKEYKRK